MKHEEIVTPSEPERSIVINRPISQSSSPVVEIVASPARMDATQQHRTDQTSAASQFRNGKLRSEIEQDVEMESFDEVVSI